MGIDTHLYIGDRWRIEDVRNVIECQFKGKVKFQPSEHSASFGQILLNDNWFCWYHLEVRTPLGKAILLSRRFSQETVSSFKIIAEVLGGALEEQDDNGNIQFYNGRLHDEDGLQYFLKYAVIHDNHSGRETDIDELKGSINRWIEKYDSRRNKV